LRFMVIGAGFGEQHLEWISGCQDATIGFIGYRRNERRARELAEKYPGAVATDDPLSVLTDGRVDAVVVATPPGTHETFARPALAAGVVTICDKPLSADLASAWRLVEAAAVSRAPAAVTFQWRSHPALRALRDSLFAGALGDPVHVDLEFHHDFLAGCHTDWPWRHRRDTGGAGALGDAGVHLFDLLRWLVPGAWSVLYGTASLLWSQRSSSGGPVTCETEDTAEVLLELLGGRVQARVYASRVSTGCRQLRARVQGTAGTSEVLASAEDGSATLVHCSAAPGSAATSSFAPAAVNPYPSLLSVLATDGSDRSQLPGFYDGYCAQALLEAALQAGCGSPARAGSGLPAHKA
jgi:predicted dehydrogenase